jgi:hypothetical protein
MLKKKKRYSFAAVVTVVVVYGKEAIPDERRLWSSGIMMNITHYILIDRVIMMHIQCGYKSIYHNRLVASLPVVFYHKEELLRKIQLNSVSEKTM